jgi:hypothetical protein
METAEQVIKDRYPFYNRSIDKDVELSGEQIESLMEAYASSRSMESQWISVEERLPVCVETGDWDGRKSELIIGETITGKKFIGCCYEGTMDGNTFFDWYQVDEINKSDWLVNDSIMRWMKIPF